MKNASKGFSLVELTITIVIFSILVSISLFSYRRFVKDAMISEGKMLISSIAKIQKLYHAESGDYHTISETSYSTVPEIDARFNKYFKTFSVQVPGTYPNSIFTVITKSEHNVLADVEIVLHAFDNSPNILLTDNASSPSSATNSQNNTGNTLDGSDTNNGSGQEKNGNNGNGNGNGNGNTLDGDDKNKGSGQEKHTNV